MTFRKALVAALFGLASAHALACYTVYDRAGRVVYNEEAPPVDMSRPLHETLPARFPGGHMVFDLQAACEATAPPSRLAVASRTGSPLLTDRGTAEAMHVPYTVVAGGIALVQSGQAHLRPRITVVPAEAVAATPASRGTVITELRNPPLTIVESRNGVTVSELSRR